MEHIELIIFGLLLATALLAVLARLARIPYPILLVLGGLGFGLLPGVPAVELDPELVLLIFLPPLRRWRSRSRSTPAVPSPRAT